MSDNNRSCFQRSILDVGGSFYFYWLSSLIEDGIKYFKAHCVCIVKTLLQPLIDDPTPDIDGEYIYISFV